MPVGGTNRYSGLEFCVVSNLCEGSSDTSIEPVHALRVALDPLCSEFEPDFGLHGVDLVGISDQRHDTVAVDAVLFAGTCVASDVDDLLWCVACVPSHRGQVCKGKDNESKLGSIWHVSWSGGGVDGSDLPVVGEDAPDPPVEFLRDLCVGDVCRLGSDDPVGVGCDLETPGGTVVDEVPGHPAGLLECLVDEVRVLVGAECPGVNVWRRCTRGGLTNDAVEEHGAARTGGDTFLVPSLVVNTPGVTTWCGKVRCSWPGEFFLLDRTRNRGTDLVGFKRQVPEIDRRYFGLVGPQSGH